MLAEKREDLLQVVDEQATRRIALVYHPKADRNRDKEWQVRLSGVDLTAEDAQRVRLIGAHDAIKLQLEAALTLEEIEMVDPADDVNWA